MHDTTALHIATITVTDPISGNDVEVGIYRELASGALFGIDGSYLEQRIDTDPAIVSSVFGNGHVLLID